MCPPFSLCVVCHVKLVQFASIDYPRYLGTLLVYHHQEIEIPTARDTYLPYLPFLANLSCVNILRSPQHFS